MRDEALVGAHTHACSPQDRHVWRLGLSLGRVLEHTYTRTHTHLMVGKVGMLVYSLFGARMQGNMCVNTFQVRCGTRQCIHGHTYPFGAGEGWHTGETTTIQKGSWHPIHTQSSS